MTIKTIATRYHVWRRYRASVRELSRLNDRELNALGLCRADIESVVRKSLAAA